jgi:mannosyltransferase OCH1-like enzyme
MATKTIHQIWLQGGDKVPKEYQLFSETIRKFNPNYEHILWDEQKFYNRILSEYPTYKSYYEKLPLIHLKVDYMRYIILYLMGGIYVDMDAKSVKSFSSINSEINEHETVLGKLNRTKTESLLYAGHSFVINNGIIISQKGSLFLEKLIAEVQKKITKYEPTFSTVKNRTLEGTQLIDKITGPLVFTKLYFSLTENERETIKLLDSEYFEPCSHECMVTNKTIIYHKQSMSWFSNDFKKLSSFYNNKVGFISTMVIMILILFSISFVNYKIFIITIPLILLLILGLFCRLV